MKTLQPERGSVLVSYPTSGNADNIFSRSVILLTEYNPQGSVGFILNKPLNIRVSDLIPYINNDNLFVYKGGPVETDKIFFIHNVPNLIGNSTAITDELYWGGDFDDLIELLNKYQIDEKNVVFFLGYSGWDCDQLNNEIEDDFWILDKREFKTNIFNQLQPEFWREQVLGLGEKYAIWANAAETPELN